MNVRLVGGSVEGVGRLEIKGNLEKWGSVCMDNWSPVNALVVCRQLCGYLYLWFLLLAKWPIRPLSYATEMETMLRRSLRPTHQASALLQIISRTCVAWARKNRSPSARCSRTGTSDVTHAIASASAVLNVPVLGVMSMNSILTSTVRAQLVNYQSLKPY